MDKQVTGILLLLILISLSAFFSGSEAAIFSLSRAQKKRLGAGSAAGRRLNALLSSPRDLLITILLGNLLVNVSATSIVTSLSMGLFGERGVVYAFVLMSVLILTVGEILPKVIALGRPERFSQVVVYPLEVFHWMFAVARLPLSKFSDLVIETAKKRLGKARDHFSPDELLTAVALGRDQGDIDDFEHRILSSIIEFKETTVKEIMTPSINVFSLPADISREGLLARIKKRGFSRIPVYGKSPDDIKGVLHVKDVLKGLESGKPFDIDGIIRAPFFIPESAHISDLFKELVKRKMHMALVIDEYGSYVGIVTMEDILEELIGEIRDAREPKVLDYQIIDDDKIIVLGSLEIDRFNEIFKTDIKTNEFETIAGYVLGAAGRIPRSGEMVDVGNLRFHIIAAEPNRIRKMKVEKL